MEAFTAFDLRFAAYSFHPFVGTSRRIPRATGLPVVPSQREHVRPTGEQASEQVNLFVRRRSIRDGGVLADIAPTMLQILGVPQPAEMTGKSLIIK